MINKQKKQSRFAKKAQKVIAVLLALAVLMAMAVTSGTAYTESLSERQRGIPMPDGMIVNQEKLVDPDDPYWDGYYKIYYFDAPKAWINENMQYKEEGFEIGFYWYKGSESNGAWPGEAAKSLADFKMDYFKRMNPTATEEEIIAETAKIEAQFGTVYYAICKSYVPFIIWNNGINSGLPTDYDFNLDKASAARQTTDINLEDSYYNYLGSPNEVPDEIYNSKVYANDPIYNGNYPIGVTDLCGCISYVTDETSVENPFTGITYTVATVNWKFYDPKSGAMTNQGLVDENGDLITHDVYGFLEAQNPYYDMDYSYVPEIDFPDEKPTEPETDPIYPQDYEYTVLENGTLEITGYNGSDTEIVIPSEIDGMSVTKIGNNAYDSCVSLTSIIIPDNITSISDYSIGYYGVIHYPEYDPETGTSSSGCIEIVKNEELTIYGYAGTAAENYANNNCFKFIDLSSSKDDKVIKNISVVSQPGNKIDVGQTVDASKDIDGFKAQIDYEDGNSEIVTYHSGYLFNKNVCHYVNEIILNNTLFWSEAYVSGKNIIYLKIQNFEIPLEVQIYARNYNISGISITKLPNKTEYVKGIDALSEIDLAGLEVMISYTNGTSEIYKEDESYLYDNSVFVESNLNNLTDGQNKIIINYSGWTASFDITVKANPYIESIKITKLPLKTFNNPFEPRLINSDGIIDTAALGYEYVSLCENYMINKNMVGAEMTVYYKDGTSKVFCFTSNCGLQGYAQEGWYSFDDNLNEFATVRDLGNYQAEVNFNGVKAKFTANHSNILMVPGDINGDGNISIADAIMIQKHIANIVTLDGDTLTVADVTKDGSISIADAIMLQKYIANIITEL